MKPLLSIIIPTKNRFNTLIPVVEALLKYIKEPDYEIIIQDNSDSNDIIRQKLHQINDPRVRYFYSSLKLSVSENCELAIENSCGEYLTMIGDDDLVSPYILYFILLMKKNNVECLFYIPGNYYWPGVKFLKESVLRKEASLQVQKHLSLNFREYISSDALDHVIKSGGYGLGNLPRFYHGIVSRTAMTRVKSKFGLYVAGSSPDMATSVALSMCIERHHYIDYPITITGVSSYSAAGLGAKGAHIAKIEDVPFLPKDLKSRWNSNLPEIWTGPTIYAQTITEILSVVNDSREINFSKMYEYMYVFLPSTRPALIPYIRKSISGNLMKRFIFYQKVLYWFIRKFLYLYFDFLKARVKEIKQYSDVESIEKCSEVLVSIGLPQKY